MANAWIKNIFISYSRRDTDSAQAIAAELSNLRFETSLRHWDARPGEDFIESLSAIVQRSSLVVAILTRKYLEAVSGTEWEVVSRLGNRNLLPVRIDAECDVKAIIGSTVFLDLASVPRRHWGERLASVLSRAHRRTTPNFPRHTPPQELLQSSDQSAWKFLWNVRSERPRHFVGRDQILERLEASIAESPKTAVLVGNGGTGKSALALELSYRRREDVSAVWWLRAGKAEELMTDFRSLAAELELPESKSDDFSAALAAKSWCEQTARGWLLVFDGGDDPELVAPWLPQHGAGTTIVTSRSRAWGTFASCVDVDRLSPDACSTLLVSRTGWGDRRGARRLAMRLGGTPLAVELASALVRSANLTFDEVLFLLNNSAAFRSKSSDLDGQGSLIGRALEACVVAASAAHVDTEQTLTALSVLSDAEIPLALVEALTPDADKVIASMVQYGLLRLGTSAVLAIHPVTRQYLRNRCDLDRLSDARARAATALCALLGDQKVGEFPTAVLELLEWHAQALATGDEAAELDDVARAALLEVLVRRRRGRWEVGALLEASKLCVDLRVRALGPSASATVWARYLFGMILSDAGQFRDAIETLTGVLGEFRNRAQTGNDNIEVLMVMNSLGLSFLEGGKPYRAEELHRQVASLCSEALGERHLQSLTAKNNWGVSLARCGRLTEAAKVHREVLALREQLLGKSHPDALVSLGHVANVLRTQGDIRTAGRLQEGVYEALRKVAGEDHPDTLAATNNLAVALIELGEPVRAREICERLLVACRRTFGGEHPEALKAMSNLALSVFKCGDLTEARALHEQVLEGRRRILGPGHPETLLSMSNLAVVLHDQGDLVGARGLQEVASAEIAASLGADHPEAVIARRNLERTIDEDIRISGAAR